MERDAAHRLIALCLAVGLVGLFAGCAGKQVSTSVADQQFEPGQPKVVEEAAPTTAAPAAVELADVYFDFDKATLRNDAMSALEADARTLQSELKDAVVLIEGHCDEIGTAAYNMVLGEKRARAVKQYLQDLGVASSRIQITSFGKERPSCTEHHPNCWQQNRRAHFAMK